MRRTTRSQRGLSMSVEAVIIIPGILMLIALGIVLARLHLAKQAVESSAAAGAREASIARTVSAATTRATETAQSVLKDNNVRCAGNRVDVNATGLLRPAGVPASVEVKVTCKLSLADATLPGLPGSITFSAVRSSPVDTYRGR